MLVIQSSYLKKAGGAAVANTPQPANAISIDGDIWDSSGAIVIPVNTFGAMGKGLALDAARRHPDIVKPYQDLCRSGDLDIGRVILQNSNSGKEIILFPTKKDWRHPSRIGYIHLGMQALVRLAVEKKIDRLALPRLGCGLGGLDWEAVRDVMYAFIPHAPETVFEIYSS